MASTSTTQTTSFEATHAYRGGYSTSIGDDLFTGHGHTDCCALTCCGILLYDRNAFLVANERPSWKGRCCKALVLFFLVLLWFMVLLAYFLTSVEDDGQVEQDDDDPQEARERPSLCGKGSDECPDDTVPDTPSRNELHSIESVLFGIIVGLSFYFLYQAQLHRFRIRRILMGRMYQERTARTTTEEEGNNSQETDMVASSTTPLLVLPGHATVDTFLKLQEPSIRSATAICGCIRKDAIIDPGATQPQSSNKGCCGVTDFCHCLWKFIVSLCCGACCGCWCQCFGMCAIAQDDRELHKLLPKERFRMDFITFQAFEDYAPGLEALRRDKVNNLLKHMKELSLLSKHLLRILGVALAALTIIACSGIDPYFRPINLLVVFMVFLQAFVIIYFVHWQFSRFDLSFDAVVKYFASGFILCTANAFVYEIVVSTTLGIMSTIIRTLVLYILVLTGEISSDATNTEGADALVHQISLPFMDVDEEGGVQTRSMPVWILVIVAFLNAFAVAAMVEELAKYFGFWMVEHPDLPLPEDVDNAAEERVSSSANAVSSSSTDASPSQQRSYRSLAAGVTVAMVTTACGFACCENFIYVFFYSRPASAVTEISTLIMRSVFPVHPLAAAIQSIGVCRRDIEKDRSMGFWWILFPALVLHGSFDFALMFMDLLAKQSPSNPDAAGSDDDNSSAAIGTVTRSDRAGGSIDDPNLPGSQEIPAQLISGLVSSVTIVLVGVIYYIIKALAQRKRLNEMDKRRQGSGEYEQLK